MLYPKSATIFAVAAIGLITCACAPQGNIREAVQPPDPLTEAKRLLNQGDYGAAAAAFSILAGDADTGQAPRLKAIAALAYQDAQDFGSADALISEIDETTDDPGPVAALAKARSMLHANFPSDAYLIAEGVDETTLQSYQRGVRARVMGAAALATNDMPAAAHAWVSAHRFPYPADQSELVLQSTWRAVSRLSESELTARISSGDEVSKGWYSLAYIASQSLFDHVRFTEESETWKQQHSGHPALGLIEELVERSEMVSVRPRQIALFLPFNDTLGIAAKAIRNGFITAWFADSRIESRPILKIYSSAAGDIVAAYARAVSEGAEFVVGPLRKGLVTALRDKAELSIGLLALNVIETVSAASGSPPGLFQFGLTPENEARQVARRAFANGKRALIIAPDSAWGKRLMTAYADTWEQIGGAVLAKVFYADESEAYPEAVKRALNIDLSEARATGLRRKLAIPLEAEPRRRDDVDVILLAGFPDNARQILPQLRYFRAENVSVFATSHVYAGGTDAERDRDLNGLVFGDMPWLFGVADVDTFNLVRRNWPIAAKNYARLHGLGVDAYRIIPYLAKMRYQQNLRIPGVTGVLWMDYDGIVHRQMTWLKFINGLPTFIDEMGARYAH